MALKIKLIVFLLITLLFASYAKAKVKIYCTEDDDPKNNPNPSPDPDDSGDKGDKADGGGDKADGGSGKADGGGDKADGGSGKADGGGDGKADGGGDKGDGGGIDGGGGKDGGDGKDHCDKDGGGGKGDSGGGKGDGGGDNADGGAGKADGGDGNADGGAGKADGGDGNADGGAGKADGGGDKADGGDGNADGGAGKGDGDGKDGSGDSGGGKDGADGKDHCDKDGGKGKGDDGKDKGKGADGVVPLYGSTVLDTDYMGEWIIHNPNCGVNAMQHQVMPNNKAVWYDTTNLGPSARELGPKGNCPANPDNNNEPDCFAHGIQYDIETGDVVSLYVETDPWCSSGHLLPNGDLMSTGGNRMGDRSIRLLSLTDAAPAFKERQQALGAAHWYPSNCVLEDGSAVVVGGRNSYSYDIVPPQFDFQPKNIDFPFLKQTTAPAIGEGLLVENNLYPFIFLLPDGNVFIFANDRAISFNPKTGETVKEYPVLQGGARNYPPSGMSALLPMRFGPGNKPISVEVVVCGGNKPDAFPNVDPRYTQNRVFSPALADCSRIKPMEDNPVWEKEQDMPSPRTMGDLLQLPNAEFLLINGAKKGTSGWDDGEDPNFTPTVYMPQNEMGKRFKELKPTNIARMYHSSSSVLPDGKILVAGSNAHQFYTFDGNYPTELRVEKFSPYYLDPKLENERPVINAEASDKVLKYGVDFKVTFTIPSNAKVGLGDLILTIYYPPFTTHGFSQNQRLLICGVTALENNVLSAVAPPEGKVAPPGYYMMFVNHRGIPSKGVWVHLE